MNLSFGQIFQTEQSGVLHVVLRVDLFEPGLHDEPVPIKMCEVTFQSGNVRLETSNSESKTY